MTKNIAVLTSGGDAPGMNAGIRAVVRSAIHSGMKVWGVERGYQGLIDNRLIEMDGRSVSGIINRGGTILHSARCEAFLVPAGRKRAAKTLLDRDIDGLVVIGGDGTYRGAAALYEEHGIRCVGMPGTIDNDIGGTDFTIGYDTALNTAVEAIDRLRDTADSHDRIFFVEVMGRHSGYLAMMSGIAGGAEAVLVPETPTDIGALVDRLRACRDRGKASSIVVLAEGDEAGNASEIAAKVSEQSEFTDQRVTVIGHLQRGGSPTAWDRILASRLGVAAVEALAEGQSNVMAALNNGEVVLRPFSDSWEVKSAFDPQCVRIADVLAT
jgi:6-phosphofructokinase 1